MKALFKWMVGPRLSPDDTQSRSPAATRTPKQQLGDAAESLAVRHLQAAGLRILQRNYRVRGGEIDCIAEDGATLVFVEVRYRKNAQFGGAAASIDPRKQRRLIHAAQHYLQAHPPAAQRPCRFDCILLEPGGGIDWIKDAFQIH